MHQPRFEASSLVVQGDLSFENTILQEDLDLFEAKIGGKIDFIGTQVGSNAVRRAIQADRVFCGTGIYFRESSEHRSPRIDGAISLKGINVDGDLAFENAIVNQVSNDLDAIDLTGARVKRNFFLQSGTEIHGDVNLNAARVGQLVDDLSCWPKGEGSLDLNQFTYEAFSGNAKTNADQRLRWLGKQATTVSFFPQPYEHCAQVLREAGHHSEANLILSKKEILLRSENRQKRSKSVTKSSNPLLYLWHYFNCTWGGWCTELSKQNPPHLSASLSSYHHWFRRSDRSIRDRNLDGNFGLLSAE